MQIDLGRFNWTALHVSYGLHVAFKILSLTFKQPFCGLWKHFTPVSVVYFHVVNGDE
jgi:hypothetical protein